MALENTQRGKAQEHLGTGKWEGGLALSREPLLAIGVL